MSKERQAEDKVGEVRKGKIVRFVSLIYSVNDLSSPC